MLAFLALTVFLSSNAAAALLLETASDAQNHLAQAALLDILARGAPILGYDKGCDRKVKTCDWMAGIPGNTKLVHLNLPGTHDTATWNYTEATQQSLIRYTGSDIPPASVFQTQARSIFQSLNDGIRVFDLRIAYNPGNDTIGFHHSAALLAPTTTFEDVLFGIYSWLDKHPTEALLVSINHESGTGTPYDVAFLSHLYNVFQSDLSKRYWVQTHGSIGTLAQARGKITLLQRFAYDLLPAPPSPSAPRLIGITLPGSLWTDNGPAILIPYSPPSVSPPQIAYIEDFYEPDNLPIDAGIQATVQAKFDAVRTHLVNATAGSGGTKDQLYITFASAERTAGSPTVTPRSMALGNGTAVPGVNQQLLPWLQAHKGQRVGVIMLDFYDAVPGLIEAAIGL